MVLKRILDVIGASLAVLFLLPLLAGIWLSIRITGKPAIYEHWRVGRGGKKFPCLKFRTMRTDADRILADLLASDSEARAEWESSYKLKNDPRVTSLGNWMRKTSIDELPQLLNVLKGDMSLVGPRPVLSEELDEFYPKEARRLYESIRPGITGLWQVSGRSDLPYSERVRLDVDYIRNQTFTGDLVILAKTVGVVLGRRGAR